MNITIYNKLKEKNVNITTDLTLDAYKQHFKTLIKKGITNYHFNDFIIIESTKLQNYIHSQKRTSFKYPKLKFKKYKPFKYPKIKVKKMSKKYISQLIINPYKQVHNFIHSDGTDELSISVADMLRKYPYISRSSLYRLISGYKKSHKGWKLLPY